MNNRSLSACPILFFICLAIPFVALMNGPTVSCLLEDQQRDISLSNESKENQAAQQQQQEQLKQAGPVNFEAPPNGQLSQQKQVAQVGQLLLSGAQQLARSPLANLSTQYASNVFDVLKDVGKTIHSQMLGQPNPSGAHGSQMYQLLPSHPLSPVSSQTQSQSQSHSQTSERNLLQKSTQDLSGSSSLELQSNSQSQSGSRSPSPSFIMNLPWSSTSSQSSSGGSLMNMASNQNSSEAFRQQGETLRQEITQRASQLQSLISSSMGALKSNGDLIVRRLLLQMNQRLDMARAKADRIISEPTNNEIAVKTLATINNGLTNLNNIINNIVSRIDLHGNQNTNTNSIAQRSGQNHNPSQSNASVVQKQAPVEFGAPNSRLHLNLTQIKEQFASAISAAQKQQLSFQSVFQPQKPDKYSLTNQNKPNEMVHI